MFIVLKRRKGGDREKYDMNEKHPSVASICTPTGDPTNKDFGVWDDVLTI